MSTPNNAALSTFPAVSLVAALIAKPAQRPLTMAERIQIAMNELPALRAAWVGAVRG